MRGGGFLLCGTNRPGFGFAVKGRWLDREPGGGGKVDSDGERCLGGLRPGIPATRCGFGRDSAFSPPFVVTCRSRGCRRNQLPAERVIHGIQRLCREGGGVRRADRRRTLRLADVVRHLLLAPSNGGDESGGGGNRGDGGDPGRWGGGGDRGHGGCLLPLEVLPAFVAGGFDGVVHLALLGPAVSRPRGRHQLLVQLGYSL